MLENVINETTLEKLIDQLILTVEQRIAAEYRVEEITKQPVEQDLQPYLWYISRGNADYHKITVDGIREVPVSYTSNNGLVVLFTPQDTVHTAFLKIVKSEYQTAIIDGILELQDGSQRPFEMDLTGN